MVSSPDLRHRGIVRKALKYMFPHISLRPTVRIDAGIAPNIISWRVDREDLLRFSPYFKASLAEGTFIESITGRFHFKDIEASVMAVFIEWLIECHSFNPLILHDKADRPRLLLKAYCFGEMIHSAHFKNAVMGVLNQTSYYPIRLTPGDVDYAFKNCSAKSKLNVMLADVLAINIRKGRMPLDNIYRTTLRYDEGEPTTWEELFHNGGEVVVEIMRRLAVMPEEKKSPLNLDPELRPELTINDKYKEEIPDDW